MREKFKIYLFVMKFKSQITVTNKISSSNVNNVEKFDLKHYWIIVFDIKHNSHLIIHKLSATTYNISL